MGLAVRDLHISLGGKPILGGVTFDVAHGELVSILGVSGAGKSTVVKAISGVLYPDSGTIEIDGAVSNDVPAHKRRAPVVFQDVRLFPNMTLLENVAFPLKMQRLPRSARLERARKLLKLVKLEGLGDRGIGQVSGGQQQRAALARALAADPRVLLLDEPFSGLDEALRREMQDLVLEIHRKTGLTTVLVTHDAMEALTLSDHIVYMLDGRVVQCGTPADLYERPAAPEVASAFGDCSVLSGWIAESVFRSGDFQVECSAGAPAGSCVDGPAICVIREDGVGVVDGGPLEVTACAYAGDGYLITLRTNGATITARSGQPRHPGESVGVSIAERALFIYPAQDSGAR